jgi:hypothetical protein
VLVAERSSGSGDSSNVHIAAVHIAAVAAHRQALRVLACVTHESYTGGTKLLRAMDVPQDVAR